MNLSGHFRPKLPISDQNALPNPDSHTRPRLACSVDGDCFRTRFALAVAWADVSYHLLRMTSSRTTSQPRFSIQTQVCPSPVSFSHPGLSISAHVAPHIGHLYTIVTADIFARYNRLTNPSRPVHFVTGTDEHGLKIQRVAHGNSQDPQVFCDRLSKNFQVCLYYVVNFLTRN